MDQQLKERLLKLYELSKRGEGGEKVNAEVFLNKLLEKHNLTIDDIDSNVPKRRYYKYTTKANMRVIIQVLFKTLGAKAKIGQLPSYKEVSIEVNDYQHVQILEEIDFHLDNFKKERKKILEDFKQAYIQKHCLYSTDSEPSKKEMTKEDLEQLERIIAMQGNLSNDSYTKKIG